MGLWRLSGRPPGLEAWLVATARELRRRHGKKPDAMASGFSPLKSAAD
jgi:hypothetical protein